MRCGRYDGPEGGGVAVNPFSNPLRIMVQTRPQDVRAGIQRLATVVDAYGESTPDTFTGGNTGLTPGQEEKCYVS